MQEKLENTCLLRETVKFEAKRCEFVMFLRKICQAICGTINPAL